MNNIDDGATNGRSASLRYQLLGLTWLLQFVNYLDRVSISVAAPTMMHDLALDAAQLGWIFAAFSFGYAFMQLPGGMLSDRFGAKAMLVGAPILFSLFTGLTGSASSVAVFMLVRFCFGMAEGSSNAAVYKVVADNFSPKEAAKAHSVWLSALALGPAVVAPVVVLFLTFSTWRHVFYYFAIPGVLVSLLIWRIVPKREGVSVGQRGAPDAATRSERRGQWRLFLSKRTTWLLFIGYLTFNIGYWGFVAWMPTYLSSQRHIDLKALGYAASIPYLFGFLGLVVFGMLGSSWLHLKRPLFLTVSYLAAALALYFTFTAQTAFTCVVGLSVSAFLLYGALAPYAGLVAQMSPQSARGGFAGLINTGGQIGGLVSPIVVGYIAKASGSFDGGFIFMIGALIIGAICFALLQPHMSQRAPVLADLPA